MAAGGPWSVKGIAPQAREAARDAARREGKSLGEWLNEIILETGGTPIIPEDWDDEFEAERPERAKSGGPAAARGGDLEALARRLEASEHRSTLAITGIDQSVRGLLGRLEAAERASGEVADHAGEAVSELHDAQSELARRLAALESDTTAQAGLEAVKSLESAVAQVAGHVHTRDQRSTERADTIETRLGELEERLSKASEDLARRVDASADHATMQARRVTDDLRGSVETHQARTADALSGMEETVARITERLSKAETLTNNAMRALEASFAHLDDRLRTEREARDEAEAGLKERVEERFEELGRELRERIEESRADTAATLEKTNITPRLDAVERALDEASRSNARTLGRVGEQIEALGSAVERRLEATERRLRDDATRDRSMEARIREVENASTASVRQIAEGVEKISERLAERIEASEQRNAETVAALGEEMSKLADRLTEPRAKAPDDLEARLRESEQRTQQMIQDAVSGVGAKLDAVRDENEANLSPVQAALASLAERLEAMETGRRGAPAARAPLPPAEEALDALDDDSVFGGIDGEPEEEVSFDEPERPNPFAGADEEDGFGEESYGDSWSSAPVDSEWPDFSDSPEEPRRAEAPRPLGATADSNFLAAARVAARRVPDPAVQTPPSRPSVLETRTVDRSGGGGRKLLVAAGVLALVTLGGAAALLFMDGLPFGSNDVQVAGGAGPAGSPDLAEMLNGGAGAETSPGEAPGEADMAGDDAPETGMTETGSETEIAEAELPPAEPASAPAGAPAPTDPEPTQIAAAEPEPPAPQPAPPAPRPQPRAQPAPEPQRETVAAVEPPQELPQARIVSGGGAPAPARSAEAEPTPPPQQAAPQPAAQIEQADTAGDPAAQLALGESRLQAGQTEAGLAAIQASADAGYAPAQYRIGKLYETGTGGLPQDPVQARIWTERAAGAGNRNAMHNLALMYAEGRGVQQSDQTAAQWFERAALYGATDSQFNLAVLYEQGRGVPQSLPDAYAWYRIAERAGDREAGERANLLAAQLPAGAADEAQRVAVAFQPRQPDPGANANPARFAEQ